MTREQINERIARNPSLAARNPGLSPELQKRKEHAPSNAKTGAAENERNHGRFSISIDLHLSNRLQDPDGALSTILDCLRDARRRFVEIHSTPGSGRESLSAK